MKIGRVILLATSILVFSHKPSSADHDAHVSLPFFIDENNPLSTLTINGVNTSLVQGFPQFQDSLERDEVTNGRIRYGGKNVLFIGMNLWKGASIYFNPEMMLGYNLSPIIGVANAVSVASSRVGTTGTYIRMQRLFLRQVVDLGDGEDQHRDAGGRSVALEDIQNKLTGNISKNNIIFTVGKFSSGDIFDDNIYAHDPSKHFLNMSFNAMNSIDYVGDAWGVSYGAAVEYNRDWWSARLGYFQGSALPPSNNVEPVPFKQGMLIGELEARYNIGEHPGSIKLIGYRDHGFINNIIEHNGSATPLANLPTFVRNNLANRTKYGAGINIQQEITENLGFFMRVGIDNKTLDFNEVTHGFAGGFVAFGKQWGRPLDEFGLGVAYSSMKGVRVPAWNNRNWIGEGAGYFSPEKNIEAYYKIGLNKNVELTLDYQFVQNPNFEKSRGPAHVFGIRLRTNF